MFRVSMGRSFALAGVPDPIQRDRRRRNPSGRPQTSPFGGTPVPAEVAYIRRPADAVQFHDGSRNAEAFPRL
jgi:hypothetical protein